MEGKEDNNINYVNERVERLLLRDINKGGLLLVINIEAWFSGTKRSGHALAKNPYIVW